MVLRIFLVVDKCETTDFTSYNRDGAVNGLFLDWQRIAMKCGEVDRVWIYFDVEPLAYVGDIDIYLIAVAGAAEELHFHQPE